MIRLVDLLSKGYVKKDDFIHVDGDGTRWELMILSNSQGDNLIYDPDSKNILGCYRYREKIRELETTPE